MKVLVTGGAGFIGGNFVHHMVNKYPDYQIVNLDLLTYAGNLETLKPVEDKPNYKFVKGDIADEAFIMDLFEKEKFDVVVNFAAESHVDRSIEDPGIFVQTNVMGTRVLLDASRKFGVKRYHQVSPDPHLQPVLCIQSKRRPVCTGLPQNLRYPGYRFQMLQQLRPVSLPGEADSAYDQPRTGRRRASGIRKR